MDYRQVKSQKALMLALAELLEQSIPLSNITIQKLVKQAQVSRSTFYRNFDNLDSFFNWVSRELAHNIMEVADLNHSEPVEHPFEHYFTYLSQNRLIIKAFTNALNWPKVANEMYTKAFDHYTKELQSKNIHTVQPADLSNYIVGAHIQVTQAWLRQENPRSPREMAQVLTQLTRDGLLRGLNLDQTISLPS